MIRLTPDQIEVLDLLDKMTSVLDVNDINRFLEEKEIVMKLKGSQINEGVIVTTLKELNTLAEEMITLRNENIDLKRDFHKLISGLNKTLFSYNQDFDDLKRKHNVY